MQRTESSRITALEETVREQDVRIRILTNIVIKQEETLPNVNKTLSDIRKAKIRGNLRITGVVENNEETKEQTKFKVQNFLKEQMQIENPPEIKYVKRIGKKTSTGSDRQIIAKLHDPQDKRVIFANVKNLKGKKNAKRRAVLCQ